MPCVSLTFQCGACCQRRRCRFGRSHLPQGERGSGDRLCLFQRCQRCGQVLIHLFKGVDTASSAGLRLLARFGLRPLRFGQLLEQLDFPSFRLGSTCFQFLCVRSGSLHGDCAGGLCNFRGHSCLFRCFCCLRQPRLARPHGCSRCSVRLSNGRLQDGNLHLSGIDGQLFLAHSCREHLARFSLCLLRHRQLFLQLLCVELNRLTRLL